MIELSIPLPLRRYCNGAERVPLEPTTVGEALTQLIDKYPDIEPLLMAPDGGLRPFVNIFVSGEDIRLRDGLETDLKSTDELEILPAIAGGSEALERDRPASDGVSLVTPDECDASSDNPVLIDVRTDEEWRLGYIPNAEHIDRGFLELRIDQVVADKTRMIVCYCQSGVRSKLAAQTLINMGYGRTVSLDGGIERWKAEGRNLEVPPRVSDEMAARYQRHLTIPEVGAEGQVKLANARVAVIGMGGLGCPVSTYLAAAGVGHIGLVDDDDIDLSNLQRQFLYTPDMVGRSKAMSAEAELARFNPTISFQPLKARLDDGNIRDIFESYDLIVDCTDNFTARYLINDEAVHQGKPVVHGAVYRFDAQVSVFGLDDGPCYRCFLPEPPPPELAPSCADAGVLGVLPGVAGLLMATEAIKVIVGFGEALSGRMLCYEAKSGSVREVKFPRDPNCSVCSERQNAFAADQSEV
ncbi:molybdopterin-synthase adenylyltransferase MoeB [Erythrobacter crassostreae]|uniref:Molybdopterin-synthase adenylyltransferase n=1 Tax=Erythrobacter crassostreae TaxID=2828328 RepID=A0A9X1JLR6_9SPHN|nr:molybdopterin-synthase adenylyltransferase MoeB [Erythrobacter crassostrea]MBV7260306.1 molybdopterin-synthase adenylyltransferase MoeB [Erythrobacter crassostrea]